MSLLTIRYQGRFAALAGRTRVWPQPWLCDLPAGHPTRRMTLFMCHYARLVLEDELPGPYTDDDARRFARLTLLADHDDLSPQPDENDAATAARLGLGPWGTMERKVPLRKRQLITRGLMM